MAISGCNDVSGIEWEGVHLGGVDGAHGWRRYALCKINGCTCRDVKRAFISGFFLLSRGALL